LSNHQKPSNVDYQAIENRGVLVAIAGYMPKPVFNTLAETLTHYKTVTNADNPDEMMRVWLHHCFAKASINLPACESKNYYIVLIFYHECLLSRDSQTSYYQFCGLASSQ